MKAMIKVHGGVLEETRPELQAHLVSHLKSDHTPQGKFKEAESFFSGFSLTSSLNQWHRRCCQHGVDERVVS
jgi:hypothetical protein